MTESRTALGLLAVTAILALGACAGSPAAPDVVPAAEAVAPEAVAESAGVVRTSNAGKPDFSAGVYADGEAWGTKATTSLPAPNGRNNHSFDKIFVFTNGADGQLPVGEAAPGNPDYNSGRWWVHTATWIDDLPHDKVVLTSYEDVMFHYNLGHLVIADAEVYFQCPLLPVK